MGGMNFVEEIAKAVEDIEESKAEALVKEALAAGVDPAGILRGVVAGLKAIGRRFENKEYFLLELTEGGEVGKKLVDLIAPHIPAKEGQEPAKVVIGAVQGDIHDIGKNLVATQLRVSGFEVYDLGINVPSMNFVDKACDSGADIIALSAFLSTTIPYFVEVLDCLRDMGLRSKFKVIIGGGTTTKAYADQIGADGWAEDAVRAATLCESLVSRTVGS